MANDKGASSDRPLGMMGTCRKCGGENQRTGRLDARVETGFGGTQHRIVSEELRCKQCGTPSWNDLGSGETNE
jgi:hypothetical protein